MRAGLTVGCILLLRTVSVCSGAAPPQADHKTDRATPAIPDILREASEIALKQEEHQHYWCDRVLLQIGEVQIRARDFDGALKSIRGSSYEYGRNERFVNLAEAMARAGKREGAFDVMRLLTSHHAWTRADLDDGVQLQCIDHLITSGDLDGARKGVDQLKTDRSRPDGWRKLAVAYAKNGGAARAAEYFNLAVEAAAKPTEEYDRARGLWETADAELAVGKVDAAKATIRRLVEAVELKDPWVRCLAFCESAILCHKASDDEMAHRLFRRALAAQKAVNELNKTNTLEHIATAQAEAGYLDDARKTAELIEHSAEDFSQDGYRERALFAIAMAQLKTNDVQGALRTVWSIEHYQQYRDDGLQKIADYHVAKGDLKDALTLAEDVQNPSRRATAVLKVATAHARSGDRKAAADVAKRVALNQRDPELFGKKHFDYRSPSTWGVRYDSGAVSTGSSRRIADRNAAEVAATAMELAQALEQKPGQSYVAQFNELNAEEVTRALARAHAASGDASEALAWAKQVGSSDKVKSTDDRDTLWAVERRIHALVGVAEGMLDRSSKAVPGRP